MIIWFLYYAFLVATGLELLFPPQFLLIGNIFMVFMISTVTRKESLKRRCISTLLICTVWMLVEVIVLLVLRQLAQMKASLMMLEARIQDVYASVFSTAWPLRKEKTVCRNPAALFHHNPFGTGEQHLYDAPYPSHSSISCGIFFFLGGCGHTSPACQLRDFYGV